MAMIKCPECGQEISSEVKCCPNCGFPIKKNRKLPVKTIGIVSFILILILIPIVCVVISYNRLDENEQSDVDRVYKAISDIGTVNIYSENNIISAENLYASLSEKCQRHVKNHKELVEARNSYDKLKAEDTIKRISEIGKVTSKSKNKIDSAESSYESLTNEQKKLVSNIDDLTNAKKQFSLLKIEDVSEKIKQIGNVTIESRDKIKTARNSYEQLTDDEKQQVSNYNDLTDAEDKYNKVAINECTSLINSIGEVTLKSKNKIDKAKNLYDSLSDELKEKIKNYDILKEATEKYEKLEQQEEEKKRTLNSGNMIKTSKWEITYKKTNISAKIYPNSTSGYYRYYYADDDSTFVDVVFQIKNIDTDILGIEDLISDCTVQYNGSDLNKSYTLYTSNGTELDQVYSWDGLDALDSTTLHVAINMPREIQSNNKSITVNLTIAGEDKIIHVR